MKIGVDAAVLGDHSGVKTGNYNLTFNLLRTLGKIDKTNQYLLYSFNPIPNEILKYYPKNFQNRVLRPPTAWMQFRLSLELILKPVDIFIGLSQALPIAIRCKSVVFCLDLAFEKYPCLFDHHIKLSWQTKMAAGNSSKIIAISDSTKTDIQRLYKVKSEKISVIHLAPNI